MQTLLKMTEKELRITRYAGQATTEEQELEIKNLSAIDPSEAEIYQSIINFENQLKLNKWAQQVITKNFQSLYDKFKIEEKQEEKGAVITSYIGSSISWLSGGYLSQSQSRQDENTQDKIEASISEKEQVQVEQEVHKEQTQGDIEDDLEFQDAIDYLPEDLEKRDSVIAAVPLDQMLDEEVEIGESLD